MNFFIEDNARQERYKVALEEWVMQQAERGHTQQLALAEAAKKRSGKKKKKGAARPPPTSSMCPRRRAP